MDEEIDFSEFDKMGTKISKALVKSKNDYSELIVILERNKYK